MRTRLVLVMACFSGPAWASEPEPTFSLDYRVPSACPGRAAFVAAIQSRARATEVASGEARVNLTVDIAEVVGNSSGRLGIALADGQQSLREIPAGSCREVVRSMAVIAALVLEGRGIDEAMPEAAPEAAPAATSDTWEVHPTPPASPPSRDAATPSATEEQSSGSAVRLRAVVRGSLESAVARGWSPGAAAGAELVIERDGWFAPSVRLLGRAVAGGREQTRLGDADFRLLTGSFGACPTRIQPASTWKLLPCALFEAGDLHGRGENALGRRSSHMPWLGVGAAVRTEHRLSAWFAFDLELRALSLFHHDRFVFQPGVVANDVPPLAFALSAGLLANPP